MERLTQAARRRDEGEPLPMPFKVLADVEAFFYRGTVNIVAASPGTGKSTFMLAYMLQCPTINSLYNCMDTPRKLTVVRAGMSLTHQRKAVVEAQMEDDNSSIWEEFERAGHISMFFRNGVTSKDVALELGAYAEIKGEFPPLVVIDNLRNIAYETDEPGVAEQQLLKELDTIAKRLNICIVILTHVNGPYNDGLTSIPLNGVMNQNTKEAHMVLALTRSAVETQLNVSVLKNRTGQNDPSGATKHALRADFSIMRVGDQVSPSVKYASALPVQRELPMNLRWFRLQWEGFCASCGMVLAVGEEGADTGDGIIGRCCE